MADPQIRAKSRPWNGTTTLRDKLEPPQARWQDVILSQSCRNTDNRNSSQATASRAHSHNRAPKGEGLPQFQAQDRTESDSLIPLFAEGDSHQGA